MFVAGMLKAVTDIAESVFRSHESVMKDSVDKIVHDNKKMLSELHESHQKMLDDYDLFFKLRGLREGIFWMGMICAAVNMVLLIICISRILN